MQGAVPMVDWPARRLPRGLVERPGRLPVHPDDRHGVVAREPARRSPDHRAGGDGRDHPDDAHPPRWAASGEH